MSIAFNHTNYYFLCSLWVLCCWMHFDCLISKYHYRIMYVLDYFLLSEFYWSLSIMIHWYIACLFFNLLLVLLLLILTLVGVPLPLTLFSVMFTLSITIFSKTVSCLHICMCTFICIGIQVIQPGNSLETQSASLALVCSSLDYIHMYYLTCSIIAAILAIS